MSVDALRTGLVAEAIRRHGLVVVLRRVEPQAALLGLAGELADAGVRCFEVTFDAASAEEDVVALKAALDARGDGPYLVGAGTVLRRPQLEAAKRAGADFAVSPVFDRAMIGASVTQQLPFIPGAFTPTEITASWAAGATFVKLFPASAVGPSFVRELRGPMPEVQLIATGGVDGTNGPAFLAAGAAAVGIGSAITTSDAATRAAIVQALAGPAR